jgi:drug/metabolite transporter (DMT)-like permease
VIGSDMRNLVLFGIMSLIWGLTWAAIKLGLDAGAPPILLAGLRYLLTASILLVVVWDLQSAFAQGRSRRIVVSALLTNTGTYGLLFWGMQAVPSGLSGLVNLLLIPVLLYALSTLVGEERPTWRHGLALGLGCVGLVGLFWSRLAGQGSGNGMGLAAIVAGTCCYCVGSVVARPLIGPVKPLTLTMLHAIIGGGVLMLISVAAGEIQPSIMSSMASWPVIGSLLYLSVLGTIVAYTLYLRLLKAWGTARAGLYAFISPIIALAAGTWLFGEAIGLAEIGGTILLLSAAGIALSHETKHNPKENKT